VQQRTTSLIRRPGTTECKEVEKQQRRQGLRYSPTSEERHARPLGPAAIRSLGRVYPPGACLDRLPAATRVVRQHVPTSITQSQPQIGLFFRLDDARPPGFPRIPGVSRHALNRPKNLCREPAETGADLCIHASEHRSGSHLRSSQRMRHYRSLKDRWQPAKSVHTIFPYC